MAMRDWIISLVLLAAVLPAAPASAQFSGDLAFTPDACKAKKSCILKSPLTFIDEAKRIWRAEAGGITDGASIPDWAQGVIGDRWDDAYIKAAVLHDYYCGVMRHSWKETHRMFYDALLALGVGQVKAKLMYYAVYLAGPKWEVAEGADACDPEKGDYCTMSADPDGRAMVVQPSRFDEMDMKKEMRPVEDLLVRKPDASLEELEAMADRAAPANGFRTNDSSPGGPSH